MSRAATGTLTRVAFDLVRGGVPEQRADLVIIRGDLRQLEVGEHLGRQLGLAGLDHDRGRVPVPQFGQRALEDQPAGPHHPDVSAGLLDLGKQVRGHEHGCTVRGDLPDQRPDLTGALRVKAVRGLVEYHQVAGCSRLTAMASRCFMPSE